MSGNARTSWSQRLAECESASPALTGPVAWWRNAYARVLRFLIARYGDRAIEPSASAMPWFDGTSVDSGKPAKSLAEIRRVLGEDRGTAAPVGRTTAEETWIVVLARRRKQDLAGAVQRLSEHRVLNRIGRSGREHVVLVPLAQRTQAFELVEAFRHPAPREHAEQHLARLRLFTWRQAFVLATAAAVLLEMQLVSTLQLGWQIYLLLWVALTISLALAALLYRGVFRFGRKLM